MGLFDKIFGRWKSGREAASVFRLLSGYAPAYQSFGGKIYESQMVRSAIHTRAASISKLRIEVMGSAKPQLRTKFKAGPNPWQTWGQFLYRWETILCVQNTAFIVPVLDEYDRVTGIYPVLPDRCELIEYDGRPWLRYKFSSGQTAAIEFERCGVTTRYQYESDFFGESNAALLPTMEMIHTQDQVVAESAKMTGAIRFMATATNYLNDADLANERKRFNATNLRGEGGMMLFPHTYKDIKQVDVKPYIVDPKEREQIRLSVNEYFGVNDKVLQNQATGDDWSAFYEGALESDTIQLSDVLTKMIFTERERAAGAAIAATANRLQYMTFTQKIEFVREMADRGIIKRNEGRDVLGLPLLPGPEGEEMPIRGEFYNVGDAGKKKKEDDSDGGNAGTEN